MSANATNMSSVGSSSRKGRTGVKRDASKLIWYALLIFFSLVAIVPILWMVSSSLKTNLGVFMVPAKWIPEDPQWSNYLHVFTDIPFFTYFKNTAIITVLGIVGTVISSSLVAYGLSRIKFKGSNIIFYLIIATMMIPPQVTIVPQFLIFKQLGWIDSLKPLIVPEWFGSPYNIFLLRQFFIGIPKSLDEAAMIDGAGLFRIYWRIILPLSKPVLAAISIFAFMFFWNDFFKPLIFINDDSLKTLTLGIMDFKSSFNIIQWNYLMAASALILLPCVLLFFFAQRYFIKGISVSGLK
ncbi:L-arabinose transport system permease protein AraQ [Paenibacillus plantiphilus]|uniref:L-arabinose transport system permease protein AraQ n=1 Tax=Paenibacillus plantiphilus TaxID=2905650 RepID=A0ABN8GS14_9BACL|nr:carbohydrate ABC transporter permease [Paenibacillus plantiphilus]CAH1216287.1 L-arabinose transport system permease protein AraQ [Paenibacillus plantiphilus]